MLILEPTQAAACDAFETLLHYTDIKSNQTTGQKWRWIWAYFPGLLLA
jgi:hypothetical protein